MTAYVLFILLIFVVCLPSFMASVASHHADESIELTNRAIDIAEEFIRRTEQRDDLIRRAVEFLESDDVYDCSDWLEEARAVLAGASA